MGVKERGRGAGFYLLAAGFSVFNYSIPSFNVKFGSDFYDTRSQIKSHRRGGAVVVLYHIGRNKSARWLKLKSESGMQLFFGGGGSFGRILFTLSYQH